MTCKGVYNLGLALAYSMFLRLLEFSTSWCLVCTNASLRRASARGHRHQLYINMYVTLVMALDYLDLAFTVTVSSGFFRLRVGGYFIYHL